MSSSGSSKSKIFCSLFASSVGSTSVNSGGLRPLSLVRRSTSKLGRAATSARASSMRLITGNRRLSASASGSSGSDSSCICGAGFLSSFFDRLLDDDSRDSMGTDLMSLLSLNFLRWPLLSLELGFGSTVLCVVSLLFPFRCASPSAVCASSSSLLWPSNRSWKSTLLPAAAIRPNMLWFMFINGLVAAPVLGCRTSCSRSSSPVGLSRSGRSMLGTKAVLRGRFCNLRET